MKTLLLLLIAAAPVHAQPCTLWGAACFSCNNCHNAPFVGTMCPDDPSTCVDCTYSCPPMLAAMTPAQVRARNSQRLKNDAIARYNPTFLTDRGELMKLVYSHLASLRPMPSTLNSRMSMGLPAGHPSLARQSGKSCAVQALLEGRLTLR